MRNRELFYQIADLIEKHPEQYDQQTWGSETECGTAHCIAGHACLLSGLKPLIRINDSADYSRFFPAGANQAEKPFEWQNVDHLAKKLLGLEREEAWILFDTMWVPPEGQTVPQALRAIGDGAEIEES